MHYFLAKTDNPIPTKAAMNAVFQTDIGKKRSANQDSGGVFSTKYGDFLIVCDGMGGMADGGVASTVAMLSMILHIENVQRVTEEEEVFTGSLEFAVKAASQAVATALRGSGTTLTAILLPKTGRRAFCVHVGDSRAYSLDGGMLNRITRDHAAPNGMLLSGLGSNGCEIIDAFYFPVKSGNRILVCSDGLTNMVDDKEIRETLMRGTSLQSIATSLVNSALYNGGLDNITVCLGDAP